MDRGRMIRRLPRASTLDEIRALLRPAAPIESDHGMPRTAPRQIRLPRAAPLIVVDARRTAEAVEPTGLAQPA